MFCQCSLGYVTFDLHRQRLEQMFSDVLVPLSELVRLGRIQEHPGEDDDLVGSPGRSLFPQLRVGFVFMQIPIPSAQVISVSCVEKRRGRVL